MKALLTAFHEVVGLFIEDGSLAVGILIWVAIAAFIFPRLPIGAGWRGPLLFVGLVVLLLENTLRSARKSG